MKKYKITKWLVLGIAAFTVISFFLPFLDCRVYLSATYNDEQEFYNVLYNCGDFRYFEYEGLNIGFIFFRYLAKDYILRQAAWLTLGSFIVAVIALALTIVPILFKNTNGFNTRGRIHWHLIIAICLSVVSAILNTVVMGLSSQALDGIEGSASWHDGSYEFTIGCKSYAWIYLIMIALAAIIAIVLLVKAKREIAASGEIQQVNNGGQPAGGKPLSIIKATARYNMPGFIGEICGPVTGFDNLRAKRISKIKGKIVMWEAKFPDVTFEDGDINASSAVAWGLNFPLKVGTNEITYVSYIDVLIKGQINRIQIPVAKIPGPFDNKLIIANALNNGKFPFKTSPKQTVGSVPVVSGWIKDLSRPNDRDEHFDDPLCPEGYSPLILGYYGIQALSGGFSCQNLGLPKELLEPPTYIMEKGIKFSSIPSIPPVSTNPIEQISADPMPESKKAPQIIIGKREFKKSELEQLFAYFWLREYNMLEFAEATEKIMSYFNDNGYIDKKTITRTDIESVLSFIWASKYNVLPYEEAIQKITEHLTKSIY